MKAQLTITTATATVQGPFYMAAITVDGRNLYTKGSTCKATLEAEFDPLFKCLETILEHEVEEFIIAVLPYTENGIKLKEEDFKTLLQASSTSQGILLDVVDEGDFKYLSVGIPDPEQAKAILAATK